MRLARLFASPGLNPNAESFLGSQSPAVSGRPSMSQGINSNAEPFFGSRSPPRSGRSPGGCLSFSDSEASSEASEPPSPRVDAKGKCVVDYEKKRRYRRCRAARRRASWRPQGVRTPRRL